MRENRQEKAARYLRERRLTITHVSDTGVAAVCRGDGLYHIEYQPEFRVWRCSCPARTSSCAHIEAIRMVVIR